MKTTPTDLPVVPWGEFTRDPGTRRVLSLGVLGPKRAALFVQEQRPIEEGELRVRTLESGVSTGTERQKVLGQDKDQLYRVDDSKRLIPKESPVQSGALPSFGYMEVGEVVESRRDDVSAGDRIAGTWGRRTQALLGKSDRFVPLPSDLDPRLGIFVAHMGPICANGILQADIAMLSKEMTRDPSAFIRNHPDLDLAKVGQGVAGRTAIVFGAGVVGLVTGLMAKFAGAREVAVVEPSPERRALIEKCGLTAVDPEQIADSEKIDDWLRMKGWTDEAGRRGAEIAFQCTGATAALARSLDMVLPLHPVIDMGYYPSGADDVRFGDRFHHAGGKHICAQIGNIEGVDKSALWAFSIAFLREYGSMIESLFITDVASLDDGQAIVEKIADGRLGLQAVFDFTQGTKRVALDDQGAIPDSWVFPFEER
jgi:hypothetical protein